MKKNIIIPVETKSREFHGKLFLALHLLNKGYSVLFGNQVRLIDYCDLVEPAIYLDKSVASTRADWFKRCKENGHEVVSWDEEGVVFFNPWMYRKLRIDPKAFDLISLFFAWGKKQNDAICEEYPDFHEKIILCGNPRFDFLRPELRGFYQEASGKLTKQFGSIILVNTNFAFYNHFKTQKELKAMLSQYPLADEPGYLDGWIDMHRQAHYAYIEMVQQLVARYPEHTIVLRPHPSENHKPWKKLADKYSNLHVDASGNVHEWILASDAVIHFNCTTAVEAFLLGVPPIAYRPGRFPRYENPLPYGLSENTFSLDELWLALDSRAKAREQGRLWNLEQNEFASSYICGLTGTTAAANVSDKIINFSETLNPHTFNRFHKTINNIKRLWRLKLHFWREVKNPSDGYTLQKFPGITVNEIRDTLDRMMKISSISTGYKITHFAKDCYWLTPTNKKD